VSDKKNTRSDCTRTSTLAALLLLATPGCSILPPWDAIFATSKMYLDARKLGVRWIGDPHARTVGIAGEPIRITSLSDGKLAVEVACKTTVATPWEEISPYAMRDFFQRNERMRDDCIDEAVRQCRVYLGNRHASFALFEDAIRFPGKTQGETRRLMYVRCLSPRTMKAMAERTGAKVDPRIASQWAKFLEEHR
jgi:hypothetical protein